MKDESGTSRRGEMLKAEPDEATSLRPVVATTGRHRAKAGYMLKVLEERGIGKSESGSVSKLVDG